MKNINRKNPEKFTQNEPKNGENLKEKETKMAKKRKKQWRKIERKNEQINDDKFKANNA